jgi:hypothetical protein
LFSLILGQVCCSSIIKQIAGLSYSCSAGMSNSKHCAGRRRCFEAKKKVSAGRT